MSTIKRGDTIALAGNAAVTFNGALVTDYTGWAASAQLRTVGGALALTFTTTLSPAGVVTLAASAVDSALLKPAVYEVDIQYTTPTGEVISTATARIVIAADITR